MTVFRLQVDSSVTFKDCISILKYINRPHISIYFIYIYVYLYKMSKYIEIFTKYMFTKYINLYIHK